MMQGKLNVHTLGQAALALALALSAAAASEASTAVMAIHSDRPNVVETGLARIVSPLDPSSRIAVTLTLPLTNKADLDAFVANVSNPANPSYGKYLTPAQFAAKYGASPADFNKVLTWARGNGLTVAQTSAGRNTISLNATAARMEQAFGVKFNVYADASGKTFFSAAAAPQLPIEVAGAVKSVYGLSNYAVGHPLHVILTPAQRAQQQAAQAASVLFSARNDAPSGHNGALSPTDINTAYQMPIFRDSGKGQTLGCYAEGGYYTGDPGVYEQYYDLPATPVTPRYVAGYNGDPTADVATEAALDADMELAMAPSAKAIYVYEAGTESSFLSSILDALTAVADDDTVSSFDISYGLDEALQLSSGGPTGLDDENTALERLAAEGISVFAAAGDAGAYGDLGESFYPASYNVEDPGSQPLVTGVGGTTPLLADGKDVEELSWNELSDYGGGSTGGGTSDIWPLPTYQEFQDGTPLTTYNGGSATYRNVPDVAADADPYVGVDIYSSEYYSGTFRKTRGAWITVGGTSVSAPLWAGFTSVVNQQRLDAGLPVVGFANPLMYGIFNADLFFQDEQLYTFDFDDVDNGDNGNANLFGSTGFYAGLGYDNNTGLGSLTGGILMGSMTSIPQGLSAGAGTPPASPANFQFIDRTATSATLTWDPVKGATGYVVLISGTDTYYGNQFELLFMSKATTHPIAVMGHLTPNTEYTYYLTAVNAAGSSGQAGPVSFYTPPN